ncbi:NAD(P)-dependent dehydrogenase (short-subunit alcohol dehydrogenase family) [Actinomycetospora succinea]|uniref:NAD(P)-dependent dehydrogenase (Short-subunit alcohol dehydrogenase family) n=1 Tax=Actinomycetospora succinea TaxID=663603 RepID=A0A4R6VCW0_9PSEU|nr:SDR family NAD(P)-dependent oxidoreductase [Actinomycetospora succinea]TDQ60572.1 NAD(P)-dependent dehydrogenase (short-subunit alcohol dehydrogenase family) [Actinomycetospora succinea]
MSTALITGASRGLGLEAARRLAEQGWTVLAGCREPASLAIPDGTDIRPIALDVTDDASVAAAVKEVQDAVETLDVLVNNAGIAGAEREIAPADTTAEDLRAVYETNVLGPVRVTHAFLPLLRRGTHPRLVMVSSSLGSLQDMNAGRWERYPHLAYPSSKAALNMISVLYAKTLADVVVTVVNPGWTATNLNAFQGTQTLAEGTDAIVAAVTDTTGPSGRFLDRDGEIPW